MNADSLIRAGIEAGIARARFKESMPVGFDGTCECGAEINPARVDLGYYRCIACQTKIEQRRG